MVFARVHLDETNEKNGCLELALGSHTLDNVNAFDARDFAQSQRVEYCHARRGDILFVKALLLHRSIPSRQFKSRRAIRVDYSAENLPKPLEWA